MLSPVDGVCVPGHVAFGSRDGKVVSYPVVETIHKDNICHVTEAPAEVSSAVQTQAQQVAEKAISCLEGAGIFG